MSHTGITRRQFITTMLAGGAAVMSAGVLGADPFELVPVYASPW